MRSEGEFVRVLSVSSIEKGGINVEKTVHGTLVSGSCILLECVWSAQRSWSLGPSSFQVVASLSCQTLGPTSRKSKWVNHGKVTACT